MSSTVVPCKTTIYQTGRISFSMLTAEQKENKTLSELKKNCMILQHEWKQAPENVAPIYCSVWGIVLQEDF